MFQYTPIQMRISSALKEEIDTEPVDIQFCFYVNSSIKNTGTHKPTTNTKQNKQTRGHLTDLRPRLTD